MKKTFVHSLACGIALIMFCNCTVSNTFADENKESSIKEPLLILQAAYDELGFDDSDIGALSRTSIPINEIYAYVQANNLNQGDTMTTEMSMNYDNTKLLFNARILASDVEDWLEVNFASSITPSINNYSLDISLNATHYYYRSNIVLVRFTPQSSINDYAALVTNVYNGTYISSPVLSDTQVISSTSTETVSFPKGVFVPGDVNNDGYINNNDSLLLAQALAGVNGASLTINMRKSADINLDGSVDNSDLHILLQYLNGSITYFYS